MTNMAEVKKEVLEDRRGNVGEDDSWLSYWVNQEDMVKKEDRISDLSVFKQDMKIDPDKPGKEVRHKKLSNVHVEEDKAKKTNENRKIPNDETKLLKGATLSGRKKKSSCYPQTLENMLSNAVFTKLVANMCVFKCPTCGNIFASKDNFHKHFRMKHASLKRPTAIDHIFNIVTHQCQICLKSPV